MRIAPISRIDGSPNAAYAGSKIEVIAPQSEAVPIAVHRGLGLRVKELFDRESLAEAGVLTATEAHHAQDLARGAEVGAPANALEEQRAAMLIKTSQGEIERWD